MLVFIATRRTQDFTIPVIDAREFVTKQNDKFFFPNQGEGGEHAERKGSGSEPPSKGKKKPVSANKGKNMVAM